MKRNSILSLACCAVLVALGKFACAQADGSSKPGAEAAPADADLKQAKLAWHTAAAEATRNHLRTVAARGDARSLLAAAILWPRWPDNAGKPDQQPRIAQEARAWFDAARSVRPRDALVAWLEASDCVGLSDSCDRDGALEFLLQTEPDNAAIHILAMAAADRSGAPQMAERHWQAAASSTTHDPHALKVSQLLYAAMEDAVLPPLTPALARSMGQSLGSNRDATPEDLRDVGTMAVWAAVAIPAYQTVTRKCSIDALAPLPTQRATQCRRVMTLLAMDQSLMIAQTIGLKKMVELSQGTGEAAAWRERFRQFHWTYENAQRNMMSKGSALPPEYLRWVLTEGELPAMRKLLEANGIPPSAPEGWLPDRADLRAVLVAAAGDG